MRRQQRADAPSASLRGGGRQREPRRWPRRSGTAPAQSACQRIEREQACEHRCRDLGSRLQPTEPPDQADEQDTRQSRCSTPSSTSPGKQSPGVPARDRQQDRARSAPASNERPDLAVDGTAKIRPAPPPRAKPIRRARARSAHPLRKATAGPYPYNPGRSPGTTAPLSGRDRG